MIKLEGGKKSSDKTRVRKKSQVTKKNCGKKSSRAEKKSSRAEKKSSTAEKKSRRTGKKSSDKIIGRNKNEM